MLGTQSSRGGRLKGNDDPLSDRPERKNEIEVEGPAKTKHVQTGASTEMMACMAYFHGKQREEIPGPFGQLTESPPPFLESCIMRPRHRSHSRRIKTSKLALRLSTMILGNATNNGIAFKRTALFSNGSARFILSPTHICLMLLSALKRF